MIPGLSGPKMRMLSLSRTLTIGEEVALSLIEQVPAQVMPAKISAIGPEQLEVVLKEGRWQASDLPEGTWLRINTSRSNHMYYAEVRVVAAYPGITLQLALQHEDRMISVSRRLFNRLASEGKFMLTRVELPGGEIKFDLAAELLDMSPSGIGFKTRQNLPPRTRITANNLFESAELKVAGLAFDIDVMWCQGNPLAGYRCGGLLKFPAEKDEALFGKVLSQLQINRLAWFYQNFDRFKHLV